MERDDEVIVMGEDVAGGAGLPPNMQDAFGGVFGVTKGLLGKFGPTRVGDTPISEAGYIGAAVGAAVTGLRPVAELMFVSFMGVCMDQLVNQGAKMRYMFGGQAKVPLTVRTVIGGGVRAAAQHSTIDYSILTHIPGLKCVAPCTPYDAKGLLVAATREFDSVQGNSGGRNIKDGFDHSIGSTRLYRRKLYQSNLAVARSPRRSVSLTVATRDPTIAAVLADRADVTLITVVVNTLVGAAVDGRALRQV